MKYLFALLLSCIAATAAMVTTTITPINLKEKGAKGDGTTDDNAILHAAVTLASSNSAGLYFPPGVYRFSTPIIITNLGHKLKFTGERRTTTSLHYTGTNGPAIQITGGTAPWNGAVAFENIGLDAIGNSNLVDAIAVENYGSRDLTFHNVTIQHFTNGLALNLNGLHSIQIDGVYIAACKGGIELGGSGTFPSNPNDFLFASTLRNVIVEQVTNPAYSVRLNNAWGTVIDGGTFEENAGGIIITNSRAVTIRGSYHEGNCTNNTNAYIQVNWSESVSVENNFFQGPGTNVLGVAAIRQGVVTAPTVIYKDNYIRDFDRGIELTDGTLPPLLVNNNMVDRVTTQISLPVPLAAFSFLTKLTPYYGLQLYDTNGALLLSMPNKALNGPMGLGGNLSWDTNDVHNIGSTGARPHDMWLGRNFIIKTNLFFADGANGKVMIGDDNTGIGSLTVGGLTPQITARAGTNGPSVRIGNSTNYNGIQFWKDETPSKAGMVGMWDGAILSDDFHMMYFNGASWFPGLKLNESLLTIETNLVVIGSTTFSSYILIPNNTWIYARNVLNLANAPLIGLDASNQIRISPGGTNTFIDGPTTITADASTLSLAPSVSTNASLLVFKDAAIGSARGSLGFTPNGSLDMLINVNNGSLALEATDSININTNSAVPTVIGGDLQVLGTFSAPNGATNYFLALGSTNLTVTTNIVGKTITWTVDIGDPLNLNEVEIDAIMNDTVSADTTAYWDSTKRLTNWPYGAVSDTFTNVNPGVVTQRWIFIQGRLATNEVIP